MAALTASTVKTALELTDGDLEWSRANVQYKQTIRNDTVVLYDLYGNAVTVRAPELLHYTDKNFSTTYPTIAATGTAITGGVLESQIVTGGQTIIYTLTNGTWAASGTVFDALRQSFINGLDGNHAEAHSWDTDLKAAMAVTTVVRTSDTIVTITLPAAGTYSITTTDEIVTMAIPSGAVYYANGTVVPVAFAPATATFTITQGS